MIFIKNKQRKIKVCIPKLKAQAKKMIQTLGYSGFDLNIILTTNKYIRKLNKNFRKIDRATDILSFPCYKDDSNGLFNDKSLGDIIISLEYVLADSKERWNRTFDTHLTTLLAHGISHLAGYDHITDSDYKKMLKIEKKLLKSVSWNEQ